ncbi:hypothetical protein [Paenibacillus spongiae]|uniref:Permease n=1 Tax=Paenibacillus spongiae TaxID=2909671 RepID=A0ABY5S8Y0_9BACL|nr:hypothetical protein [Paenibacillus spongiae]UVI30367.1 hypothetical protein L1F29_00250 [Paenibacillus spongiae]
MLSTGKNMTTMLCALWLIVGVFIDGYHHQTDVLESFFTPWHAMLYSGFAASAAWMLYLVWQNMHINKQSVLQAIPPGYGAGLLGVAVFLIGGIGDLTWHEIFGIEQDIAALLSPSHLLLLVGILLIVTSPLRQYWMLSPHSRPSFRFFIPVLLSASFVAAMMGFFLMYAWELREMVPAQMWHDRYLTKFIPISSGGEGLLLQDLQIRGIMNILVTTGVMLFPIYWLMKRWQLPFGSVAVLCTLPNVFIGMLSAFEGWPILPVVLAVGLIGDFILLGGKRRRLFAVVLPILLWGFYFIVLALLEGIWWPAETLGGAIVLSAIVSYALYTLSASPSESGSGSAGIPG